MNNLDLEKIKKEVSQQKDTLAKTFIITGPEHGKKETIRIYPNGHVTITKGGIY